MIQKSKFVVPGYFYSFECSKNNVSSAGKWKAKQVLEFSSLNNIGKIASKIFFPIRRCIFGFQLLTTGPSYLTKCTLCNGDEDKDLIDNDWWRWPTTWWSRGMILKKAFSGGARWWYCFMVNSHNDNTNKTCCSCHQCTMCILSSMFSFQPNKLRHISKVASW